MANVVLERPRWARRALALQLTGLSEPVLLKLVNDGFVRCRKLGGSEKSGTVFNLADVEEWLDKDAAPHAPFVLPPNA